MTTTLAPPLTLEDLLRDLGNVEPGRVRLHPAPGTAREADVLQIRDRENKRPLFELVDGTLVEKVMGFLESIVASELIRILGNFVQTHDLGVIIGESGMMCLAPGLVRIPDVAFLGWQQFLDRRLPREPIPEVFPDLAIELLSAGNSQAEMERKTREYLDAGTQLVWIVDPRSRTARVIRRDGTQSHIAVDQSLDGESILPGLRIPLADLFGNLPAT